VKAKESPQHRLASQALPFFHSAGELFFRFRLLYITGVLLFSLSPVPLTAQSLAADLESVGASSGEREVIIEDVVIAEDLSILKALITLPEAYHQTLQKDFFNLELVDLRFSPSGEGGSGESVISGIEERDLLQFGEIQYPDGVVDEYGDVQYYDSVELKVPLLFLSPPEEGSYSGLLRLNYQLCNEAGTCYLPESKDVDFSFSLEAGSLQAGSGIAGTLGTEGLAPFGAAGEQSSLLLMILFAFIGGLLLNVMPCVFPILSIRALNLVKQSSSDRKSIRTGALLYGAGVLATFLLFAGVVLILKAGGELAGWGFQFQNPSFVLILSAILFVFALSLFDLFIFQPPVLGGRLAQAQSKGHLGAFLNGLLAVILATPCTAPFLGSALGFAFSQPGPLIVLFFLTIGAGFALPFVLLGFLPSLIKKIPKPGPWMDWFKEIMGLVLIGTAIYFLTIFSSQVGREELLGAIYFLFALASAAWLYGKMAKPGAGRIKKWIALLVFTIITVVSAILFFPSSGNGGDDALTAPERGDFSPERMTQLREEGKPLFLIFSAQWCSVCKVNDRRVLNTQRAEELFAEYGVEILYGDYTNADPVIAKWIKRLGRAGVPVYAFYRPGAEKPRLLPELLSFEILEETFSEGLGAEDDQVEMQDTPAEEGLGGVEFF
jgi:thiol:disulfide interchange protein